MENDRSNMHFVVISEETNDQFKDQCKLNCTVCLGILIVLMFMAILLQTVFLKG